MENVDEITDVDLLLKITVHQIKVVVCFIQFHNITHANI